MTTPNPPSLPALVRYWLGTDRIQFMEEQMAKQDAAITELGNKFDNLTAVTTDIATDFAAFRAAVEAEREELSPAGQAALDQANAKADAAAARLADLDVTVGDADGSDTPTEPVETEPAPVDPENPNNA